MTLHSLMLDNIDKLHTIHYAILHNTSPTSYNAIIEIIYQ